MRPLPASALSVILCSVNNHLISLPALSLWIRRRDLLFTVSRRRLLLLVQEHSKPLLWLSSATRPVHHPLADY
jgi:hypothetical protein